MKRILILYDYRGYFPLKLIGTQEKHYTSTMDINTLKNLFEKQGFNVELSEVSGLDYNRSYSDFYVLYCSNEDPGLFFKEYIEDALLFLKLSGAYLIPSFEFFRAHSNKAFQEMLRQHFSDSALKVPFAKSIGHLKELDACVPAVKYPVVVKIANGAGSKGVILAKNESELRDAAKKLMKHTYRDFVMTPLTRLEFFLKRGLRILSGKRIGDETFLKRLYTNKIIIEDFIPELSGDNKVLVFSGKYFVLSRENRDNDFRASGSGKFSYSKDISILTPILELAKRTIRETKMPIMSLDIAQNSHGVYLLEFQCVHFGPYTLQYAPYCFVDTEDGWITQEGPFELENEYVRSICEYILKIENGDN